MLHALHPSLGCNMNNVMYTNVSIGAIVDGSSSTQHYYGDFRYHFRYHWPEHLLCESMKDMNEVGQEDRITVRQKLASKTGFTGLSHLHHLYYLYKFDVLKDVVFDTMHTLLLRIISRHLDLYLQKGFIKNPEIDKRLLAMPWTSGLSHYYNVHVQSHH